MDDKHMVEIERSKRALASEGRASEGLFVRFDPPAWMHGEEDEVLVYYNRDSHWEHVIVRRLRDGTLRHGQRRLDAGEPVIRVSWNDVLDRWVVSEGERTLQTTDKGQEDGYRVAVAAALEQGRKLGRRVIVEVHEFRDPQTPRQNRP
jgi:hypothetical protein